MRAAAGIMPGLRLCGPRTALGSLEVAAVAFATLALRGILMNATVLMAVAAAPAGDTALEKVLYRANIVSSALSMLLLWACMRGRFVDRSRDWLVCAVKVAEVIVSVWEAIHSLGILRTGAADTNMAARAHIMLTVVINTATVAVSGAFVAQSIAPCWTMRWDAVDYELGFRRVFCCIVKRDNDAVFRTLGLFAADFFGDVDLTVTDLFAGVMLVKREQKARLAALKHSEAPRAAAAPAALPEADESIARALEEAAALIPYALSVYGSLMFGLVHGQRALASLAAAAAQRGGGRNAVRPDEQWSDFGGPVIEHAARNSSVLAILHSVTKGNGALGPLLYATFHDEPGASIPFALFLDVAAKCVVIAVRGTSSLEGVLNDLLAVGELQSPLPPREAMPTAASGSAAELLSQPREERADAVQGTGRGTRRGPRRGTRRGPRRGAEHGSDTGGAANHLGEFDMKATGREFGFDGEGEVAHHAFMTLALATVRELQELRVLDAVLYARGGRADVAAAVRRGKKRVGLAADAVLAERGWGVSVVGHSMGAGVAALVALLLRSGEARDASAADAAEATPAAEAGAAAGAGADGGGAAAAGAGHSAGGSDSDTLSACPRLGRGEVRCVAIGCPLGTVSPRLAAQMRPYVTSVVLGDDVVARASVSGLECSRDRLLSLVAQCGVSPGIVAAGAALGFVVGDIVGDALGARIDARIDSYLLQGVQCDVQPEDVHRLGAQSDQCDGVQLIGEFVRRNRRCAATRLSHTPMHNAGRVLHLELERPARIGCGVCALSTAASFAFATYSAKRLYCVAPPRYAARWLEGATANVLQELLLTRWMLDDHFPFKVRYAIETARAAGAAAKTAVATGDRAVGGLAVGSRAGDAKKAR